MGTAAWTLLKKMPRLSHLAGFSMSCWTARELITHRITVENPPGHKIFPPIIFSVDELPGLSTGKVVLLKICPPHFQHIPDFFLSGSVALPEDRDHESHQVASLVLVTQLPIKGEVHIADKGIEMRGEVSLLRVKDKTQPHLHRSSPDFREVALVVLHDILQHVCLADGLLHFILEQQK